MRMSQPTYTQVEKLQLATETFLRFGLDSRWCKGAEALRHAWLVIVAPWTFGFRFQNETMSNETDGDRRKHGQCGGCAFTPNQLRVDI